MTIKQYDCTNGGYQYCSGCCQMSQEEYGDYVRVDDIRERLEEIVNEAGVEAAYQLMCKLLEELK